MAKFAKRLFAGALAAAVALTTVISSDMTALAAKTKATKIKGSTYTTADLIWEDNFNGDKLNTKYWNYEAHEPGWVNQEWQSYPSQKENEETQNIYVKDGKLTIQAKKTKNEDGTYSYTSGRINTQNKVDTKYGRFEARIKMPKGKGFLPAFWMMPTDENLYGQWPKCGEIDITEVLGDKPNTAHSTLHFGEPHKQKQGTYTLEKGTFNDDFHVYACEWEPGEMRFYIDNKLFYTENDWFTKKEGFDEVAYPAPYDQPFYIILNLAVGGSWVGYPDKTTKFDENAQMVVDYVKVYQKDSYKENVKKPENKVTVRKPGKDGNYVVNSNFAKSEKLNDGKDWEFMTAGTGDASAKISKKALHITTKNAGDLDYSVQVVQANIPMEQGYQYKLSFDAYADKNRTIKTGITAPDNGYIRYFNDTTVNLTTKKKTYSYTFDMKSDTDPNGRVEFNLGNQGSTAGVHISNVKVVRVKKISLKEEKTVRPDGNYVYNGEFQEGADRLNYWTVKKAKGATVKVTNTNNVRQLKAVVPASVKKASDVTVKQTKIAIKGGKTYSFSFDAKRTGAKNQTMTVKVAGETYKVKLTEKMKNYKFELKPAKGTKNATLEFQLGTQGTTVIDNVRIMENGLIINGDFSAGLTGFEPWANNPSDISYVVDTLNEDSAFCMDIKDTGDQDWHVQLKQTGVKLEKGQNYKVSFKVKGTMERDIKFAFQRNGLVRKTADGAEDWTVYFEDGQIPVTKKWTTYSAIFEMGEDDDADTSMSFSLGAVGGKRITDKHTVMIDDIVLEKTDEKPEKEDDDSLILNGKFNKGLTPFETWAHEAATMESGVNKDKEFEATVSNTGTEDWHVQLKQVNIPLESGETYTFSFRAKSDMDREIKYAFQKDGNKHNDDWTVYFEESNIPVTKEWKTYTTVFKMNNASDKEASFSFNLGAVGKQIKEKHTITIDDVSLKVATEEEKKQVKNASAGGGEDYGSSDNTSTEILGKPSEEWKVPPKEIAETTFNDAEKGATVAVKSVGTKPEDVSVEIKELTLSEKDVYHFSSKVTSDIDKQVTVKACKGADVVASNVVTLKAGEESDLNLTIDMTKATTNAVRSLRSARLRANDSSKVKIFVEMGKHEGEDFSAVGAKLPTFVFKNCAAEDCRLIKEEAPFAGWGQPEVCEGGSANVSYEGQTAVIKINAVGTEDYSVKFAKKGFSLKQGQTYQISFDVESSADRTISWGLIDPDNDWNWYTGGDPELKAGKTLNVCTTYTCDKASSKSIQCYFSLGQMFKKDDKGNNIKDQKIETPASTVKISNLKLELVIPSQEEEKEPDLKDQLENGWKLDISNGGAAKVLAYEKDVPSFTIRISAVGTAVDYSVKLQKDELSLENGKSYEVSFDIKSSEGRKVKWSLLDPKKGYAYYGGDDLTLGKDENYAVKKVIKVENDTSSDIQFGISMGWMGDGTPDNADITISNFKLLEAAETDPNPEEPVEPEKPIEPKPYDTNFIINGDFANASVGWTNAVTAPGAAEVSFDGDRAIYNISDVGTADWNVQLKQGTMTLEKGETYEIAFDIKSSAARTVKCALLTGSYDWYGGADIPLTKDQTKNVKFNVDVERASTEDITFVISMGLIKDEAGNVIATPTSTIEIDNVSVKKIKPGSEEPGETPEEKPEDKPGYEPVEGNLLAKADFGVNWKVESDKHLGGWWPTIADWEGVSAQANVMAKGDGSIVYEIKNAGTATWHVQLKQNLAFEKDHRYEFKCTIESSEDRTVGVALQKSDCANFANQCQKLKKDEPQVISGSGIFGGETTEAANGSFQINMGRSDSEPWVEQIKPHVVTISAISVIDLGLVSSEGGNENPGTNPGEDSGNTDGDNTGSGEEPVPETNMLKNADFSNVDDSINNWIETIANWDDAAAARTISEGAITYNITNVGKYDYDVQLKQSNLNLVEGAKYKVTFDVTSTETRTIKSGVMSTSYKWYGGADIKLTKDSNKSVKFEFIMEDNDPNADFYISMGKIKDEETPASKITISNLKFVKVSE